MHRFQILATLKDMDFRTKHRFDLEACLCTSLVDDLDQLLTGGEKRK